MARHPYGQSYLRTLSYPFKPVFSPEEKARTVAGSEVLRSLTEDAVEYHDTLAPPDEPATLVQNYQRV
jgi:hypothetical protein